MEIDRDEQQFYLPFCHNVTFTTLCMLYQQQEPASTTGLTTSTTPPHKTATTNNSMACTALPLPDGHSPHTSPSTMNVHNARLVDRANIVLPLLGYRFVVSVQHHTWRSLSLIPKCNDSLTDFVPPPAYCFTV